MPAVTSPDYITVYVLPSDQAQLDEMFMALLRITARTLADDIDFPDMLSEAADNGLFEVKNISELFEFIAEHLDFTKCLEDEYASIVDFLDEECVNLCEFEFTTQPTDYYGKSRPYDAEKFVECFYDGVQLKEVTKVVAMFSPEKNSHAIEVLKHTLTEPVFSFEKPGLERALIFFQKHKESNILVWIDYG